MELKQTKDEERNRNHLGLNRTFYGIETPVKIISLII